MIAVVKIRTPLVGLAALGATAMLIVSPSSPARAATTVHYLLYNVYYQECVVESGTTSSDYLTACPNASATNINHSALWSWGPVYNQVVNMHSDGCMIVTGATSGSGVWITGPTSSGSGYCTPVTVDEWTTQDAAGPVNPTEGLELQFVNAHSHLCMTAVSTGAIEQVTCGAENAQWWVEEPTNSAN
jgi:hypothetical protein